MGNIKRYSSSLLILTISIFIFGNTLTVSAFNNPILKTNGTVHISGELKKWHKVTLSVEGPSATESDTNPNPFLDYSFSITFKNESKTITVPGFFAADGNAANTGATSGNIWQVRFRPFEEGVWTYTVNFTKAENVAISGSGVPIDGVDGLSGSFKIEPSNKTGRDFRGKGRLQYNGTRYLQFAETKEYFLKAGADAPENLLAYDDFDNTPNEGGLRKSWSPHITDWKDGDPTWMDSKGKGLIGAVNYLASTGCNVFSFLTYSVGGDDKNVFMHTDTTKVARLHFDCSKLDQWEILFDHADELGMYLHIKTQEEENDNGPSSLDGGEVGTERKLYYNQLIARYGHHLALNWNLGEENTQTPEQQRAMAQYFHDNDPYKNHIVLHTFPYKQIIQYPPMLGNKSEITGVSIQTEWSNVHDETKLWVEESTKAGKPWVVANDEQGLHQFGVPPDPDYPGSEMVVNSIHDIRKQVLWGNLMAGGAGVEYYFGYKLVHSDLACQDWRSRDQSWNYAYTALNFFQQHIPFTELESKDNLVSPGSWCLAKDGAYYLVYLPLGKSTMLDLSGLNGKYNVKWLDPVKGGNLQEGETKLIAGGSKTFIGMPPYETMQDWAAIITPDTGKEWPPIANFTFNQKEGKKRFNVQLDASLSSDLKDNGSIVSYSWDFGDGNTQTSTNKTISYTYKNDGTYDITLKVKDNKGHVATQTKRIIVFNSIKNKKPITVEQNGLVVVEMESIPLVSNWEQSNDVEGATGNGAIQWTGNPYFDDVSNGKMTYNVKINTPGTYVFDWRVAISRGESRSEHNDTWLKIDGVKHYYGINQEGHKVKPRPYCEEGSEYECPNKEEGLEGYLKIYGGAVKNYVWMANTSDGRRHSIEVVVDKPGMISINIAARSSYQSIDRFILYKKDTISVDDARDLKNEPSKMTYEKIK
jgi:hypothetical protein